MQRIGTGGYREFAPGWETEQETSKTLPDWK